MTLPFWIMTAVWLVTFAGFIATQRLLAQALSSGREAIEIAKASLARERKVLEMLEQIDETVTRP